MIKFFHDDVGILFKFLHFIDLGEGIVVVKTKHDLKLFLD